MTQTIHTIPNDLLETYLEDLRSEAETVAHIIKFLNDSMTARAGLAARLEEQLRDRLPRPSQAESKMIEPDTEAKEVA